MNQELPNKVWSNPAFHEAAIAVELAWLRREVHAPLDVDTELRADKLMQAAAILACSKDAEHRRAAFRIATCSYELFAGSPKPFDQALRVVLTRLGNFPSILTRSAVAESLPRLPWHLAAEEISDAERRTVNVRGTETKLTNFQNNLWQSLNDGTTVAVSAPTSAGKSFVLQAFLTSDKGALSGRTIVYIVPTRALITQVASDITARLPRLKKDRPRVITIPLEADEELPEHSIYVMTQERAQLMLTSHPQFSADIIIVDEAHAVGEGARGVLLQWVIDDLLQRNPDAQILFASPNIKNLDIFGTLFGLPHVEIVSSDEPTVAQNFLIAEIETVSKGNIAVRTVGDGSVTPRLVSKLSVGHTLASRIEKLVHVAKHIGQGHSNIVYANGAADAEKLAMQLADLLSDREITPRRQALAKLSEEVVHGKYVLAGCLKRGIGFHYSFMPTVMRAAIETAFANGDLDYLVCTSTLLQGVNLPAKNIFMCKPEKGYLKPLESTDFWNLAGRAGRLLKEFQGNIFLIDYKSWDKQPLDGPKAADIVPSIESTLKHNSHRLLDVIASGTSIVGRPDQPDLESTFVRLLTDYRRGEIKATLRRAGMSPTSAPAKGIIDAIAGASTLVTLPTGVLRQTPNVSAHKQQRLFDILAQRIEEGGEKVAKKLVPSHPREDNAFKSYADILELCHGIIMGRDINRNLHKFHALMAQRWMRGTPLPAIIEAQLKKSPGKDTRKVIRDTLEVIEKQIRFETVRLFGCYTALLVHALGEAGMTDVIQTIPSVPLFLEVGASDKTMVSFIALGLSRIAAMKLNEISARKDLDVDAARHWLASRNLEELGLSSVLMDEVHNLLEAEDTIPEADADG
ncbi:MAG: DEAD/DEAH box helicase [Alphaproteobacteria bacterium]|nr:DEAD/DEAH box helicase [Alphaproteobacteria bacterium]